MFPEQSSLLQNAAPRSELCTVAEIGPPRVPPKVANGELMGPVQTRPFHAQSAFSLKENPFGVGFKLRSPPAKQQCPRSQRQPRAFFALGVQRAR